MREHLKTIPTLGSIRAKRDAIFRITDSYGISNIRIFGSVARGEAQINSDVDLLVEYPANFSLLDLAGVVDELEQLLGHRVELASGTHLREELKPYILRDVVPL